MISLRRSVVGKKSGINAASKDLSPWMIRIVSISLFLIVWEVTGRQVNPILMSYPSAIIRAFFTLLISGELVLQTLQSLRAFSLGFLSAIVLGILIGMLMGAYRSIEYLLDPFINALYATPNVALVPLIILWLGLGLSAKICIVFIVAFFPIVVATDSGVKNISNSLVEIGRAYGLSSSQIFRKIIFPGSIPFIITGVRLAVGRAVVGMVVAEFFTAIEGLGGLIILYSNKFETAHMFVPIIMLAVMGVFFTELVRMVERKVAAWKETERVTF